MKSSEITWPCNIKCESLDIELCYEYAWRYNIVWSTVHNDYHVACLKAWFLFTGLLPLISLEDLKSTERKMNIHVAFTVHGCNKTSPSGTHQEMKLKIWNRIVLMCYVISWDEFLNFSVSLGLKTFSNWPTYPQLYANGELLGGLDIVKELIETGELQSQLPKQESLEDRLKKLVSKHHIVLFMKGSPDAPRCGFSKTTVGLLKEEG